MARNESTSAVIDGMLKVLVSGGLLATTLVAPNALLALDKPLNKYFEKMDSRAREREYTKLLRYMRRQGLVKYSGDAYEHGVAITNKGKDRAMKADLDNIQISVPKVWDQSWRIVFFDIPEKHKTARDYLGRKLKDIGFVQLQKSVFVHPFPCRAEVEAVVLQYDVAQYVTYIKTSYVDSGDKLKNRFAKLLG